MISGYLVDIWVDVLHMLHNKSTITFACQACFTCSQAIWEISHGKNRRCQQLLLFYKNDAIIHTTLLLFWYFDAVLGLVIPCIIRSVLFVSTLTLSTGLGPLLFAECVLIYSNLRQVEIKIIEWDLIIELIIT